MESKLLEYGAIGILALVAMISVTVLWKHNLTLQNQINDNRQEFRKALTDVIARYEKLVTKLVERETKLEKTLEALQEGLSAKELLAQYIEKLQQKRD